MRRFEIRLVVREEVGVARHAEIVRCGVPLPSGVLRDPGAAVVQDERGVGLPCQVLRAETDGQGWVRWLTLAFPVTLRPLGTACFTVGALGALKHEAVGTSASVQRSDEGIEFSTGLVGATVTTAPFSINSADLAVVSSAVVLTGPGGERFTAHAPADGVTVLHDGPLVAQVALNGRYEGSAGSSWAFRGRVTAFAGAPSLDLEVVLVNDADPPESEVSSWTVELETPPVQAGVCGVFAAAHRSPAPFEVRHRGEGHPRGIFATSQVVGGDAWADASEPGYLDRWEWSELHGRMASNWVTAEGAGLALTVAAARFAENHPSGFSVHKSGVSVQLWPADPGELRLTQGAAKTRVLRLTQGMSTRAGQALDSRIVAVPLGAEQSGSTPAFLPYLPEDYPNLEAHIREELSSWYQSGQSLGFHDFGDSVQGITRGPRTGYSANNEHDALLALTLHYLRSGERAYFDSAEAYADHLCDMDLIHHSTIWPGEVGGLRAHGRAHVHYVDARTPSGPVRTSIDTGHLWTEGLVLFGQVAGDQRCLDAARQVADCIVGLAGIGWTRPEPGPRNSGWPLMALTAVAKATQEDVYLDAARFTAEAALAAQAPDGRWLMRLGLVDDYCAWQNAVLLIGLHRLMQVEDSSELRKAFVAGSRALLDLGRNRDGTFIYLNRYDYRWANRSALVRESLGLAFEETSDDRFLRAGLAGGARWYRPRGGGPALSNDVAEWRGHLPFLARAHEAGLLVDLPESG